MNLQDFKSQIDSSSNILIVLPMNADADSVASAALLFKLLSGKGKKTTISSSRAILEKYTNILNLAGYSKDNVINEIKPVSYVVSVGEIKEKVDISWNRNEDKIDLVLTPEGGEIDFDKISYSKEGGIYDLVISVNVSKLDDLGPIYSNHAKLYEGYNIVSVGSELQVNNNQVLSLFDNNYSTTSEIIFKNYSDLDGQIDTACAEITAYGIVGNTNGLQRVNNGRTYGVISEISNKYQIDVPFIVRKYFYSMTKDEVILRERILKNIKFDESRKVVYSVLTKADLGQINLSNFDFSTVLPFNVNGKYDYSFLVYEDGITSNILIYSVRPDIRLDQIIMRAKGFLGKSHSTVQINSNANDSAIRMLNVISGGSLEDKIPSQIEQRVATEVEVKQNVQVKDNNTVAPVSTVENVEPAPVVATSSPFIKAESIVVDSAAEPMKKANYFSSQDKPFDKAN